jgi:16S rRNA (cytidine1402-2'-O)-methyltransferase
MTATKDLAPGLYVVATPIGNLEDLSPRAARVLRDAHVVACEDTRTSGPLLTRVGSTGRRMALHDHNEDAVASQLLEEVAAGKVVALISDAGTPLVSDPGYPLLKLAAQRGTPVVAVPGPSAVLAALCVAGLPTARFHFVGFLPDRAARRDALLREVAPLHATLVFYTPAREVPDTLGVLLAALGDRQAAVCRELTKLHEEGRRGTLAQLRAQEHTLLGEAVVVVDGAPDAEADASGLDALIGEGLKAGESPTALAKRLARETGLPRQDVYQRMLQLKC